MAGGGDGLSAVTATEEGSRDVCSRGTACFLKESGAGHRLVPSLSGAQRNQCVMGCEAEVEDVLGVHATGLCCN